MSPKSASELLDDVRPILGSVPPANENFVCSGCLGPVDGGWDECYPCHSMLGSAPAELAENLIAITTAAKPGPWYTRLAAYKNSAPRELVPVLASVVWKFVRANQDRVQAALGGEPDTVIPVPSTRGVSFERQPLRQVASMIPPWRTLVQPVATHDRSKTAARTKYQPGLFSLEGPRVRNRRIIVLEDTWVTGAHVVSLAGALLDAGAKSVMMLAIGRVINTAFWTEDHPYRAAMRQRYDETAWPRP